MTSTPALGELLANYVRRFPEEHGALEPLLAAVDTASTGPAGHGGLTGAVRCSAVVLDRSLRVLHLRPTAGDWVLPGGRQAQADQSLLASALHALTAQTGLEPKALCLTPQLLAQVFDIEVTAVAPGIDQRREVDIRFAFHTVADRPDDSALPGERTPGAGWLPLDEVPNARLREKVVSAGLTGRAEPLNASALIHDGRGRYLLHLRDNYTGIWEPGAFSLLGGGRELTDQSLEDTLRRELAEEVPGLHLTQVTPYCVEDVVDGHGLSTPIQIFAGRWHGDTDQQPLTEGVLLHWFTTDVLHRLRLLPSTRELILRHAADPSAAHSATGHSGPGGKPPALEDLDPEVTVSEEVKEYVAAHRAPVGAADALIRNDKGEILLVDPGYKPGWDLPGGMLEDEGPEHAVAREALEELGVQVDVGRLLAMDTVPAHVYGRTLVAYIYAAHPRSPVDPTHLVLQDEEITGAGYFPEPEALALLPAPLRHRLAAALDAERGSHTAVLLDGRPAARSRSDHYALLPSPMVAATVVLTDEHGRVLVQQPSYKQHAELCGGMVEAAESPAEGAAREALEEVGWRGDVGRVVAVDSSSGTDGRYGRALACFLFAPAPLTDAEVEALVLGEEVASVQWLTRPQARKVLPWRLAARMDAALDARAAGTTAHLTNGRPDVPAPRTPTIPSAAVPSAEAEPHA